jgi:alpha-mannosidase
MRRRSELTELPICTTITLRKGSDAIEVETEIKNNVRDHCLRVHFPTHLAVKTYFSDTAFDVVERPVELEDYSLWREIDRTAKDQQNFTAVNDGKVGLAVVAPGQPECGVNDSQDRAISLTLFRGFAKTIGTTGEPGGQILRPLSFRYAVCPIKGKIDSPRLYEIADRIAAGIVCTTNSPGKAKAGGPNSMIKLSRGIAQLAACKKAEDGSEDIVIRLFNPTASDVTEAVTIAGNWKSAKLSNMLEETRESLKLQKGCSFRIKLTPKKIVTVRLSAK